MKIKANFNNVVGKVKPMHGVDLAPNVAPNGGYPNFYEYMKNAGIPYVRTHDVGGAYGGYVYVDIPNIFRDFDADENDPASYDFVFTDKYLEDALKYGMEPYFRLGVTIEGRHMTKAYRIFPPKDFGKWARICEHIIRHYNEGWADGFEMGIKHWEIWGEPDSCYRLEEANLWRGTPEEYFEMYTITANHLKNCFGDKIKVGGYGAIGLYDYEKDPDGVGINKKREELTQREFYIQFFHDFLKWITSEEHKAPIDFFSWHSYEKISFLRGQARYARKVLENYGLSNVEDHLNEWNLCYDGKTNNRNLPIAPVSSLSAMLALQKEGTSAMMYYAANVSLSKFSGMFNPNDYTPYLNYYAFLMFNDAYKLGEEVETSDCTDEIYVLGAKNDKKKVLILTNLTNEEKEIELELSGVSIDDVEILMINKVYRYTLTGKKLDGNKIKLPPETCAEIRFL